MRDTHSGPAKRSKKSPLLRNLLLSAAMVGVASFALPMVSFAEKNDKAKPEKATPKVEKVEKAEKPAKADKNETYQLLTLFGDVFERVRTDYVEETKDADLIEAALNGMLSSLDPHSSYMNEKAFKEMQVQTKGEFGGLGIEVTMENALVRVVSPIDDTPAAMAGIRAGDYISYIDDDAVLGLTLQDAVEKMRGAPGSKVKLTILREGTPEPIEVSLVRDIIKVKSAKARVEGDDVIYLRVTSFAETTTDALKAEFDKLKSKTKNLRGIVLDLRNNPGGLLDQAVSVSDLFLKQGEVVSTRERDPQKTKRYNARSGNELVGEDVPVVVLINNGSASASEIVAGALQDHHRAIILGTKSFGKGSVQTVIPLTGHGAMRLTTARYYTPSGHSIQAKGIVPDIEVQPAKIELIKGDKVRLEADLRRRLQNLEDKKETERKQKEAKNGAEEKPPADAADAEEKEKALERKKDLLKDLNPSEDYQLQRALDLLRAVDIYQQKGSKSDSN